ncbi:MAG: hypothetical protein ACR2O7_07650 [Parasphingorhabdus sp.]
MKNILSGAVAAIALVAISAPAAAQTAHQQTNQLHYAGTDSVNIPLVGNVGVNYEITNPTTTVNLPIVGPVVIGEALGELGVALNIGTRYTAETNSYGNSDTATPTVKVNFRLKGTVNKDCSFYSGNNESARSIDFGVIGIRTGNNENVNNAFEMVGPATANIETLTAGCNFNNEVEITKDDSRGLVNSAPGGYDTLQFQANIPYRVLAKWTGVALNSQSNGVPQSLLVGINAPSNQLQQGAWRSDMQIDIVAPAVNGKGLVAGQYKGTTTLTLRAL